MLRVCPVSKCIVYKYKCTCTCVYVCVGILCILAYNVYSQYNMIYIA